MEWRKTLNGLAAPAMSSAWSAGSATCSAVVARESWMREISKPTQVDMGASTAMGAATESTM
jgi:hypothetical protein